MAEDRISSIIDTTAIEAEIAKVEGKLTELSTTLKTFPKANLFQDAGNPKELNDANRQLSTVLDQLKVKNAELTLAIKEQNLAAKQLAAQKKAEAQAAKEAAAAAKAEAAERKAASKQAQIDGQERLKQLRLQAEEEEKLAAAEKARLEASQGAVPGTYNPGGNRTPSQKVVNEFTPTSDNDKLAFALVQDQRQLAAVKEDMKLLTAEYKLGKVSQADYDEQVVKSIQVQQDLKLSIANTTKELSLQAKENLSIPGTIQGLQARNAVLSQQASQINVVNASPEDVTQLKSLNDEIDKNNELIRVNKDLLAQQKINIGNYPTALGQTFKTLNTELEQVQGKLVQGNFGAKETEQLTAKQTVLQNALSLTGKTFKSSAAEASAYKQAAVDIGQVYGKDSSIFKQFAEGVKTGAANTKALANEVAGVATKGKGFVSFLSAAWSGIRKLAYAIPGLGIGGVVLLLLGPLQAAGEALVKWSNRATQAGRDFQDLQEHIKNTNEIVKKSADAYAQATSQVIKLREDVKLAKDGLIDKDEVLKEYNETMGKTTGHLKNFDELEAKLVADGPDYIQLLFLKAKATAAYALAGEAARKALTAQTDAEENFSQSDAAGTLAKNFGTLLKAAFGSQAEAAGEFGQEGVKQINKNAKEIKETQEKAFKDLQAQGDDFEKQAAALAKKHNWHLTPDANDVGKGRADTERLLDEFRKKTLKETQEYLKALDEAQLKQYKTMADDQNQSLAERLASEKQYYDKSLEMAKQNAQDQIDAVNLEADIADKRAGKIKDPKKRADTLIEIENYRITAIKKISEEGNAATLKINEDYYSQNVAIANQAYEKIKKEAEEAAKFIQEQQKIAFQNQKDNIDIDKNNQILQLEKDFQDGSIKNVSAYNKRREDIETEAAIKAKELELKQLKDHEAFIEAFYGFKNIAFIQQAADLEVQINDLKNKKILDQQKKLTDSLADLRSQLEDSIQSIVESGFDAKRNKNDADLKAIQDRSQKEIDAINASTLAEEDKQKRTMAIQKQADFQSQQIEKRQQKQDLARAKFEKAASIVRIVQSTAEAIAKAVAEFPLTGGMPFVAIDAAIGAAQLAAVLAQPLPHFKSGTKNAPKGKAVVGEEGSELVVDRYGKMFITPHQPSLIELAGGEKIFRHDETEKILSHYNLLHIMQQATTKSKPVKVNEFNEKIYRELRTLNGKPPFIIQVQNGMETTDYYRRNIKS